MLTSHFHRSLQRVISEDCQRERLLIDDRAVNHVKINHQSLINFCSNDYLNLSTHPDVIAASIRGTQTFGTSSTSSASVSGYLKPHYLLEQAFADFLKCDKAILFPSGYHANLAVLTTFADRESLIVADKLSHASLIDGMILSRAKISRYSHQDIIQAEKLLNNPIKNKLLITESVFSMEGDITPVNALSTIAKNTKAHFIIDDAHGIGILGINGGGILEQANLTQHDISVLIAPLGKAFASQGAIVAGNKDFINTLLQLARTYRYTTALSPAASCAALAALTIIKNNNNLREKLNNLILYFNKKSKILGLNLISEAKTPIRSILIGDNTFTLFLQKKLMEHGFLVSCIRPPTVPKGTARIRITLNAAHTEENILQLLTLLAELIHDQHKN